MYVINVRITFLENLLQKILSTKQRTIKNTMLFKIKSIFNYLLKNSNMILKSKTAVKPNVLYRTIDFCW